MPKWIVVYAFMMARIAFAGDDASGLITYSVDLSTAYSEYEMTEDAKRWSESLARNLKYSGKIVHFVKTSIKLSINSTEVEGAIYLQLKSQNIIMS